MFSATNGANQDAMTKAISFFKESRLPLLVIPFIILLSSWYLANDPEIISKPGLGFGITIDLVVVLPLSWLLIIARTRIPKFTVLPVTILAILFSSLIIPEPYHDTLDIIRFYLLPLAEMALVGFVIFKAVKTISGIRKQTGEHSDAYEVIRNTCSGFTDSERIAAIFATELAMFWYAFGSWKAGARQKFEFSSYKENGVLSIIAGILLILIAETIWLHKVLLPWNAVVAWIIFGISVYSAIQLFAHFKAVRSRSHTLEAHELKLRSGLLGEISIPYTAISSVSSSAGIEKKKGDTYLSMLGELEPCNTVITLHHPLILHRPYGSKKQTSVLFFSCDDRSSFISLLDDKLKNASGQE